MNRSACLEQICILDSYGIYFLKKPNRMSLGLAVLQKLFMRTPQSEDILTDKSADIKIDFDPVALIKVKCMPVK